MVKKKAVASRLEDARSRMYQDLILESAEFVFGEKGFESSTMQEIASEAGVSLKTIYASFEGKRELYTAIMLWRGKEMFDSVAEAHQRAEGPLDKLISGTRAFVEYLFAHPHWSRIHVRSQISWAMRPESERAAELWDEGQRAHVVMLNEGIEAGLFHPDDPLEMAMMIRAMTRIQVVNAIESGNEDVEGVSERLVGRLVRMVCCEGVEIREVG